MKCELISQECTNMKNDKPQCYNGCGDSFQRGTIAIAKIKVKCPRGYSQNITGPFSYPQTWDPSFFLVRQEITFTNGVKKEKFERRVEIKEGKLKRYSCKVE